MLHLGNIDFVNSSSDEAMVSSAEGMAAMASAAALLGVRAACAVPRCAMLCGAVLHHAALNGEHSDVEAGIPAGCTISS